jgi:hypothetical protein
MAMNYEISHSDSLVQVQVTGTIDEDSTRELWAAIVKACDKFDCYDILGTSRLDQAFSTMTGFSHSEIFTDVGVTLEHRIAWVDLNGESEDVLEFTESVLVNRAKLNGGLFPSIEAARKWLNEKDSAE